MKHLSLLLLIYCLIFTCPSLATQEKPREFPKTLEEAKARYAEARLQAEAVVSLLKKAIETAELELQQAEEESLKAMANKEALIATKVSGVELVVASQLEEAIREKVQLLREKLEIMGKRIQSQQELLQAKDRSVALLERKTKLNEEATTSPLERASLISKEIEVAEAYLQASNAKLKEKDSELARLRVKVKESQEKIKGEKDQIKKDLKGLEELPFRKEEGPQRFLNQSKLLLQKHITNVEYKLNASEEGVKLAEEELEWARLDSLNAQLQVDVLKGLAALLNEKLKAEELRKKEEEAELALKAEEEKKKRAEIEKLAAQKEKDEAIRKAEELAQQKLEAESPEQKRVLEMESLVFTLQGEIAKRKDALITEGVRRYEDNTEYKKLARDVHNILGGENTPSEIKEEMLLLKGERVRWEEKLKAIESLLEATQKEKTLLIERLQQAHSELTAPTGEVPKIIREAEAFKDETLAKKLVLHAEQKIKLLKEQEEITAAWITRIEERREIIRDGLLHIDRAVKELSEIKASNIWARREWTASWSATKEGLARLLSPKRPSDIIIFIEDAHRRKTRLGLSLAGALALIASTILGGYYCKKWCRLSLKKLEGVTPESYVKVRLLPVLFRVLQRGISLWLILGLCFGLITLFEVKGPVIRSLKYGLIVFSIYSVLISFLRGAVRPKGQFNSLLTLPPSLAKHSYVTLRVILLYSAIFITIIGVLGSFGPNTQEILWRVYYISILALFIWFVAPKSVFLALLSSPQPQSKLRKIQRGCIHVAHPLTIAFLVFLIVLSTLGYTTMSYALIGTLISSVITLISVAVARKLITTLILDKLAHKTVSEGGEVRKVVRGFKVTRAIVDYSSVIISIVVVVSLWIATVIDFSQSPAAPEPFKNFASGVVHVLATMVGVMGYKLNLGEGNYVTPFRIMIGLVLVAVSFLVAAAIKRLLHKRILTKLGLERGMEATISSIITYLIVAFSILFAMTVAGVPLRSLAFFAGALGIGIGFGLQNIIQNFVSGIILLFERPVRVGDIVILDELGGTVERIGPRSTTIITPDNIAVVVPNSRLIDSRIVNWSQPNDIMRVHIFVGVAYGTDLELVKKCLLEVASQHSMVRKYPEPTVRFEKFGDSSLVFELIYWVDNAYARWITLSELNFAIDKKFREHNITIPFPQQDLHIRTVQPELPQQLKAPKGTGQQSTDKEHSS